MVSEYASFLLLTACAMCLINFSSFSALAGQTQEELTIWGCTILKLYVDTNTSDISLFFFKMIHY